MLCLEDEVRKAQINKQIVAAVFFDVEKAYDLLWIEGLLIKLHQLGVKGNMLNWVRDFLSNRSIQVKVVTDVLESYGVENGTPQGSLLLVLSCFRS